ncbi:MAG: hypothetical protein ACJZ5B_07625 [Candidatus Poseidoniaceae archaeon]
MLAWRDDALDWWWVLTAASLSAITGLVIALEGLLSHDTELLRKLTKFARMFQLFLVAWLWGLLYWATWGDLDLHGAEPMLEVVVVWISVFTIIEIFNRFRLGKIRWNGGSALDKIVGFSALLTDAEVTEMRSNSSQIMAGLRLTLHGITLVWLCIILSLSNGFLPSDSALDSNWGRPTLWLASMYGLMFVSEVWLRMRGRMPADF